MSSFVNFDLPSTFINPFSGITTNNYNSIPSTAPNKIIVQELLKNLQNEQAGTGIIYQNINNSVSGNYQPLITPSSNIELNNLVVDGSISVPTGSISQASVTNLTTNLAAKAPIANPTFTGTVNGITKAMVGLSNVDNTTDLNKPVSTATQSALDLKANLASPTFTGTVSGITKAMVGLSNVDNTTDLNKPVSTAQQSALDLKANLASPTFTGTVSGITKAMVGLSNVDNTTDLNKPVSTATQSALDLKANLASPTFTGTVSGITKAMVGLSNVDNTSDTNKPVSTATQSALDLKANLASPTFTGSVTIPSLNISTSAVAPTKTQGDNSTNVATTSYVDTAISNLVATAPLTLNTLNELATALGNDANFSTTVTNNIATKGGLSLNNTWTNTNTFNSTVNVSSLPVYGATTLIDKSYTDTQLATKGSLSGSNTWSGANNFTNNVTLGDSTSDSLTINSTLSLNGSSFTPTQLANTISNYNSSSNLTTLLSDKASLSGSNVFSNATNRFASLPLYGSSDTTDILINKKYVDDNVAKISGGNSLSGNQLVTGDVQVQDLVIGDGGQRSLYFTNTGTQRGQISVDGSHDMNIVVSTGKKVSFKTGSDTSPANYTIGATNTPLAPTDLIPLSYFNTRGKENKYTNFNYGLTATSLNSGFGIPDSVITYLKFTQQPTLPTKGIQTANILVNYNVYVSDSGVYTATGNESTGGSTNATKSFTALYTIFLGTSGTTGTLSVTPLILNPVGMNSNGVNGLQFFNVNNIIATFTPIKLQAISPTKIKITFGFPNYNSTINSPSRPFWISAIGCSVSILHSPPSVTIDDQYRYYTPSACADTTINYLYNSLNGSAYLADTP